VLEQLDAIAEFHALSATVTGYQSYNIAYNVAKLLNHLTDVLNNMTKYLYAKSQLFA